MAASKSDIRSWFQMAKLEGDSHLLVVCDQMDWEDRPVPVKTVEEAKKKLEEYRKPTSAIKIMEVYNLQMDMEAQLEEHRAFHL